MPLGRLNMSASQADRNLLFGILALQMDCIDRDQLVAAMNSWILDKSRPLDQILLDQEALDPEDHALLAPMVARHLAKHNGNATRCLDKMYSVASVHKAVSTIADPDIQTSLEHLNCAPTQLNGSSDLGPIIPQSRDPVQPWPDNEMWVEPLDFATSNGSGGTSAGRFRVLRPHARGGLGEVFVAHDEELGRQVALKEIRADKSDHQLVRSRFVLEAEITGNLEHPGIVPVYGLGCHDDGRPFYAMRFVQGDSLKQAIEQFREKLPRLDATAYNLELRDLLRRFIDVCNAIAYAHSRGVLHRDLKPDNVMLGKYGETLIIDWGLAKATGQRPSDRSRAPEAALVPPSSSDQVLTQGVLGTPSYMSPEQASGRLDDLSPATDIYSLGATLYALLTGRPPVQGSTLDSTLEYVKRVRMLPPRIVCNRVPSALSSIAMKALSLRPEDRYASAQALAEDVQRFLADEPVMAHRDPLSARLCRWVRTHRTMASTAAATCVLGALSLAVIAGVVTSKNAELVDANATIDEARQLAEGRLDLAMTSIEDYFTGVSEEALRGNQLSDDLRDRLLAKPREFYEQLTTDLSSKANPSEREREMLARGHYMLGRVLAILGRSAESIQQSEAAVSGYASLISEEPRNPEHRESLAQSLTNLGLTQYLRGQLDSALRSHRRSVALLDVLVSEYPGDSSFGNSLAGSLSNLGLVQASQGDFGSAVASYDRSVMLRASLVGEFPEDAEYRKGLAGSLINLGQTQASQGQLVSGVASYSRSVSLWEKLVGEFPDVPEYRDGLVRSLTGLGIAEASQGNLEAAIVFWTRSVSSSEWLVEEYPSVPKHREVLALSLMNLGIGQASQGDFASGVVSHSRSVSHGEWLVEEFPDVPKHRKNLANSLMNLAIAQESHGDSASAVASHARSLSLWECLIEEFPDDPEYRDGLADGLMNLGVAQKSQGDLDSAIASWRRSVSVREWLVQDQPDRPDYQSGLGGAFYNLGLALASQDRHEEAVDCFREAIGFQRPLVQTYPGYVRFRQNLGNQYAVLSRSLLILGCSNEAVDAAREHIALWPGNARMLYNGSCYLSLCVPFLEELETVQAADGVSADAVSTLNAAIESGWDDAVLTAHDSDLDPVRDREDFRVLLGGMFDRIFPETPFARSP